MIDILLDSFIDSVKLIPFLFVTYLAMGFLEHATGERAQRRIKKADKIGPVWGSIIGVIPQCGFSTAATYFYIGRIITIGTLISIYMSTSDEMLPMLISENIEPSTIAKILLTKAAIGMISGIAVEILFGWMTRHRKVPEGFTHRQDDSCHCGTSIVTEAAAHTLKVFVFVFIISFAIGVAILIVGRDNLGLIFSDIPVLGEAAAGIVGLIPNCAASVVITQLYIDGIIGAGPMMSGLLVSSGVGLLVLLKENHNKVENLSVVVLLLLLSVGWGCLIDFVGITF